MPGISRKATLALAATASLALLTTACTGQSGSGAGDDPNARTTLTFWHGWSAPAEVKAVQDVVDRFEKAHPGIKVKVVGNINDDKLNQALRAGGSNSPDVVSSFTTSNVGKFCSSGAFADLEPFVEKSKLDLDKIIPKPMLDYTQFEGTRCALPLLGDAYGLYYNKDAFAKAGITGPPGPGRSSRRSPRSSPRRRATVTSSSASCRTTTATRRSSTTTCPSGTTPTSTPTAGRPSPRTRRSFEMFTYQKKLVDDLGGFAKLEKYRNTFGDEWGAEHPFHTGQVAMQLDGEWRLGMARDAGVDFEIGTAPMPVADDEADEYGKGFLSGTIMGIAPQSEKQNAAWELVRFMTTDTEAVVSFANAIHNVPSTFEALKSPT